MAKNGSWNKSVWRKLDNLKKIDQKELLSIIQFNTEDTYETIRNLIPVRYGGLKTGVYGEVNMTSTGVTGRVGIDNDPHINLRYYKRDDVTNREVADILATTQNKSQPKMADIEGWLEDYIETTRNDVKNYWDSKLNGGK